MAEKQEDNAWHVLTASEACQTLKVQATSGLPGPEVERRRRESGENILREEKGRSPVMLLLSQFNNALIWILGGAIGLSALVGDSTDALIIFSVILFNTLLGFFQEYRAENAMSALKNMLSPEAMVRRDGRTQHVAARMLVPGDIVLLEAGQRVPADGRLIETHHLEIDESSLTGESVPDEKKADPLGSSELPLADRENMAYLNTVVTRGRATLLITATGKHTQIGQLAELYQSQDSQPSPLQQQMSVLGRNLAILAGVLIAMITAMGWLRGLPWGENILTAIALAVAAIPEGLPAVVTITLALGMQRMVRQNAVVKRLASVETLGSTSVICSDKTGTLTQNKMSVKKIFAGQNTFAFPFSDEGLQKETGGLLNRILLAGLLCNDSDISSKIAEGEPLSEERSGDPTELALVDAAHDAGLNTAELRAKYPRTTEIPFDSSTKRMVTVHRQPESDQELLLVKGAPDVLIEQCFFWKTEEGVKPLTQADRSLLLEQNRSMAAEGLRLLAVAEKATNGTFSHDSKFDLQLDNLIFLGLIGLQDPPRVEASRAIKLCHQAGIDVKMISGDHPETATAIGRQMGLTGGSLTGRELDQVDEASLASKLETTTVFARVAPEHKVRIVKALQKKNRIVAMTGDGVNDAPALKAADIGVAMGITGTDVSKEAADMVLTDDNFATIVEAVREGRTLYGNIIKFVMFQLSTNFGALISVATAPLLGWPIPLNPIQILWVNIIMDGPPAIALGLDRATRQVMQDPPRSRKAQVLSRKRLLKLLLFGTWMAAGTLGLYAYQQYHSETVALSQAFTTFVLFQVINGFNVRSSQSTVFSSYLFSNRQLLVALGLVVLVQVAAVHVPFFQRFFQTAAMSPLQWGQSLLTALSILIPGEVLRFIERYRYERTKRGRPAN